MKRNDIQSELVSAFYEVLGKIFPSESSLENISDTDWTQIIEIFCFNSNCECLSRLFIEKSRKVTFNEMLEIITEAMNREEQAKDDNE